MDNMNDPWNYHRCKLCSYKTKFLHCILRHERQHRTSSTYNLFTCDLHSPEKYKCQKCEFQTDFKVLLTEHFDSSHKTEKETGHYPTPDVLRSCENCDFQTYSSLVLLRHDNCCNGSGLLSVSDNNSIEFGNGKIYQRTHKNQEKHGFYHCSYCSFKTKYKTSLNYHVIRKHTPEDQIYWFKCEHCSYKAKQKSNLHQHIFAHHPEAVETEKLKHFKCHHKTTSKWCLERHIQGMHVSLEESNVSIKPPKFFKTNLKERKVLTQNRSSENVNWMKCELCSYKSKCKRNLKSHMIWKHTPEDQISWYKCIYCSYKTKTEFSLLRHIFHKHHIQPAEVKRFKCDNCRFKTLSEDHMKAHYDLCPKTVEPKKVNPFKSAHSSHKNINIGAKKAHIEWLICGKCSYKVMDNAMLREHIRLEHTPLDQVNWLMCVHCCYKTIKSGALKNHVLQKHLKFKCQYCSFRATNEVYLGEHMIKLHLENVEPTGSSTT